MKKINKVITVFTASILLMNTYVFGENVSPPIISADSAVLMDAETGQVLYGKNIDKIQFPASITKIMTVLLGVEKTNPQDIITMSDSAVFSIPYGAAHIALDVDENIRMKDAMMAALLPSANEACNGIAEYISGSVSEFANLMNERAKEAGALNTNFVNPNGLHEVNHVTTAYDMGMITRAALEEKEFRDMFGVASYQIEPTNKQPEIRYLWNTHKMIKGTDYNYEGVVGGKTGYTPEAKNTLVTVANNGTRELISVMLYNESGKANYLETIQLFDYGFDNFKKITISSENVEFNDEEKIDSTVAAQLEGKSFLIHNNLDKSDIVATLSTPYFEDELEKQSFEIKLKEDSEYMYQNIGKINFDLSNIEQVKSELNSESNKTSIIKIIFRVIISILIILFLTFSGIYYYVNREYYRKKRRRNKMKKYAKNKNYKK